jgi:hypothetical protein
MIVVKFGVHPIPKSVFERIGLWVGRYCIQLLWKWQPSNILIAEKGIIMSILLIILIILLLGGGGFGYSRFGAVGGSGIVGTILLVILVLWLLGALGTPGHL